LVLCGSTLAGDLGSPPAVSPGDVPRQTIASQTSGEQTADGITRDDNAESVVAAALTLLDSVLALL
jgi:hypothetical protein